MKQRYLETNQKRVFCKSFLTNIRLLPSQLRYGKPLCLFLKIKLFETIKGPKVFNFESTKKSLAVLAVSASAEQCAELKPGICAGKNWAAVFKWSGDLGLW